MDQRRYTKKKPPGTSAAPIRRSVRPQVSPEAAARKKRAEVAAAKKKKQQTEKRMRMTIASCIVALLSIGGIYILFSRDVPDARPTSVQAPVQGAMDAGALYTPAPTPKPTPTVTPEPTEQPGPTPRPRPTPYVYQTAGRKLKPDRWMIALTFDDGPNARVTPRILDILKKNGVKATFFQLGENAVKNPSITRRVVEEGHQIAIHSYDHPNLSKLTEDEILQQIDRSVWAIEDAGGVKPRILRPPYGAVGGLVKQVVDMPMVNWTVDTEDWKNRTAKNKVKDIYKHMIDDVKDGDVILCHDLYSTTADAVEKAIPALKKLGFQFVTIDELYEARGPHLEAGRLTLSANNAKNIDVD